MTLASTHGIVAGFETGYAYSAAVVCQYRQGPMFRVVDYEMLDADANFRGTRNFFVAMRIYGKPYACTDAMSNYGPVGVIRPGYLD
jgi:hypothetical protein